MRFILNDQRQRKGVIWNLLQVLEKFPVGNSGDTWNDGRNVSEEKWLDEFVYRGFLQHGIAFLEALDGRFAIVFHDLANEQVFLARDHMGEMPFHYLIGRSAFFCANTIFAIKEQAKEEYSYEYVRAFPHAHFQTFDLRHMTDFSLSTSIRPGLPGLFHDFEALTLARAKDYEKLGAPDFSQLADLLRKSIEKRLRVEPGKPPSILLSGGLDSLSVAVAMRSMGITPTAYTLTVDDEPGEADMAKLYCKKLGIPHVTVNLTHHEIITGFRLAIKAGESYHLYNIYCAVGMLLMGKKLREKYQVSSAFCGEAVNETVGDYTTWRVFDPAKGQIVTLQHIDFEHNQETGERILMVWGHSTDKGKFNRHLGSGLAKHAGSRMVKPFLYSNINLECPYYDKEVLIRLTAIPPKTLHDIGHKPGLMWRIFKKEFEQFGFSEEQILDAKKYRLQDGNAQGKGGISSILLENVLEKREAIIRFNEMFDAKLNTEKEIQRLYQTH